MVSESVLRDAFEHVLPDDREDMDEEEMAQHLLENVESLKEYLRKRGFDKSGEASTQDLLKSFYGAGSDTTTYFDSETVKAVESAFAQPDVDSDHEGKPSLSHWYGGTQPESQGGSAKGDTYHESG